MIWTVAGTRKRFADFLKAAQNEPQRVERYGELVGVMLGPTHFEDFLAFQQARSKSSIGSSYVQLRRIQAFDDQGCDEELDGS